MFWLKLILSLALKLPRWSLLPLIHLIIIFYLLISPQQKAASRHYLDQVLMRKYGRKASFLDIYRHFLWFATTILDRVYFLTGRNDLFQISYENLDEWLKSLKEQSAQLFLGAHYGSLDAIRTLSLDTYGVRIKVVLKVDQNEGMVTLLNQLNPGVSEQIIPHSGMNTVFDIHETLNSGVSVAILKDRAVGGEPTARVQFFDDELDIPISAFKLAKRFDFPVSVFFSRYEGGNRYLMRSESLDDYSDMSYQQMAQWYMDRVQQQCLESPYNWFNFYQYWHAEP